MRSADVIVAARRSAGLSQDQLAARLRLAQSTIAEWESGEQRPSFETLLEVVHACGRDLMVGLARFDDSYDSLIAQQLRLSPRERIEALAPPWVAKGFDLLGLLEQLAPKGRFVVVDSVAGAFQGSPLTLGWRTLEIVAAPSSIRRFEQLLTHLQARPLTDEDESSRSFHEEEGSRAWVLPSGGQLRVTLLPRGTYGYCDLARDAETMPIAEHAAVRVASVIDLIRIAECSVRRFARTSTAALWSTLEMQHRERERAQEE